MSTERVDGRPGRAIITRAVTSGPLAQLAEQLTLNQLVPGSSPGRVTSPGGSSAAFFVYQPPQWRVLGMFAPHRKADSLSPNIDGFAAMWRWHHTAQRKSTSHDHHGRCPVVRVLLRDQFTVGHTRLLCRSFRWVPIRLRCALEASRISPPSDRRVSRRARRVLWAARRDHGCRRSRRHHHYTRRGYRPSHARGGALH